MRKRMIVSLIVLILILYIIYNLPINNKSVKESEENANELQFKKIDKAIEKFKSYNEDYTTNEKLRLILYRLCYNNDIDSELIDHARNLFLSALKPTIDFANYHESWLSFYDDASKKEFDIYTSPMDQKFIRYLRKDMKIASVGCGAGRNLWHFAVAVGKNGKVYAVDIDPNVGFFIFLVRCKRYILYGQEFPQIVFINNSFDDIRYYNNNRIIEDNTLDVIHMEDLHVFDDLYSPFRDPNPHKEVTEMRQSFVESCVKGLRDNGIIYLQETHRKKCYTTADAVKMGLEKHGLYEMKRQKDLGIYKMMQIQVFKKLK